MLKISYNDLIFDDDEIFDQLNQSTATPMEEVC